VPTLIKRVGAVLLGWLLLFPALARILRIRLPGSPPTPDELERAYRKHPQTRDTVETPTFKAK
jgi:hypothetical protein